MIGGVVKFDFFSFSYINQSSLEQRAFIIISFALTGSLTFACHVKHKYMSVTFERMSRYTTEQNQLT